MWGSGSRDEQELVQPRDVLPLPHGWDTRCCAQLPAVPGASRTPTLISVEINVGVAYREP